MWFALIGVGSVLYYFWSRENAASSEEPQSQTQLQLAADVGQADFQDLRLFNPEGTLNGRPRAPPTSAVRLPATTPATASTFDFANPQVQEFLKVNNVGAAWVTRNRMANQSRIDPYLDVYINGQVSATPRYLTPGTSDGISSANLAYAMQGMPVGV